LSVSTVTSASYKNNTHYLASLENWYVSTAPPHALLFNLTVETVYSGLTACYYATHKLIPV